MSNTIHGAIDSQVASTADIEESALVLHSMVGEYCWLAHGSMLCFSELGNMSYLSTRSKAFSCHIGNFSSISWNVSIGPANHDYHRISSHSMLFASRFGMIEKSKDRYYNQYEGETIIGSDVWIGCNAVIMRGVNVGHGAVIGANSVITKDVQPYSIMGGVNKTLKKRFEEDIIKELLDLQWWSYPIERIKQNLDLIAMNPTKDIIKEIRERLQS